MKRRRVIITVVIVAVVLALLRQIPVPHPFVYDPADAAEHITAAPEHKQFYITRGYGYLCGKSSDVNQLFERASALPKRLHINFYSGAGLTFSHPDPAKAIVDIQRLLPEDQQRLLIEGLLATHTQQHLREPDKVMALSDEIVSIVGGEFNPRRGIAKGFSYALSDDLIAAIEIGQAYPTPVFLVILDEIGREIAMEDGWDPDLYAKAREGLSSDARCALARGFFRGGVLRHLTEDTEWWPGLNSLLDRTDSDCESAALTGAADALAYVLHHREEHLQEALAALPLNDRADELRVTVKQQMGPLADAPAGRTIPGLPGSPSL